MTGFTEFALIITVAAFFGVIVRKFKQPEILGYIIAGIVLAYFYPSIKDNPDTLKLFSKIGVAFLLFIVGLELDLSEIKKLGTSGIVSSIGQVIFSIILGVGLSLLLGFDLTTAAFISIALSFSSTIIVVKILTQKSEIDTLHGKLSVVFLVIQDFAAMIIMILISAFSNFTGKDFSTEILSLVSKGIFLFSLIIFATRFVLPYILKFVNKERETLFITVIAWALFLSALAGSEFIGFSVEIGALLAGISLADKYEHLQIESWMRPLRDFFLTLFFVLLGLDVQLGNVNEIIAPAIALSAFVLFIKPLIIFILLRIFKYNDRVAFSTAFSLGQISEFSLLVVAIGVEKGSINSSISSMIIIVGGLTMVLSSYFITYKDSIFTFIKRLFHSSPIFSESQDNNVDAEIIVLGCHRAGKNIIDYLSKNKRNFIVIDHNPLRINQLNSMQIHAMMGDLRDFDFMENLKLSKAKFIISTIPAMEINENVLQKVGEMKNKPKVILLAKEEHEVSRLYDMGADYVIYPYVLIGQKINLIVKGDSDVNKHKITTLRNILSVRNIN